MGDEKILATVNETLSDVVDVVRILRQSFTSKRRVDPDCAEESSVDFVPPHRSGLHTWGVSIRRLFQQHYAVAIAGLSFAMIPGEIFL